VVLWGVGAEGVVPKVMVLVVDPVSVAPEVVNVTGLDGDDIVVLAIGSGEDGPEVVVLTVVVGNPVGGLPVPVVVVLGLDVSVTIVVDTVLSTSVVLLVGSGVAEGVTVVLVFVGVPDSGVEPSRQGENTVFYFK